MLDTIFFFTASMHGLCDYLTLHEMGFHAVMTYLASVNVFFLLSRSFKEIMIGLLILPGLIHFWSEDGLYVFFLAFSLFFHPRIIIQLYFILIHAAGSTIKSSILSFLYFKWTAMLWLISSFIFATSLDREVQDRLFLSVIPAHLILKKI